jgi:prepilin-type N-terminal cleavage/methylation domain-containing protein
MKSAMQRKKMGRKGQAGMTLIELLIAMTVLAIGMGGILIMITAAMSANSSTRNDSTATMLGQMVIEELTATPGGAPTVFDCQGNAWVINGTPGNGALLNAATGDINWIGQTYAAAPAGYKMQYVECGAGNKQSTYEVRWNVANLGVGPAELVTVSSRQIGWNNAANGQKSGLLFSIPVTLRTLVGPTP